MEDRTDNFCSGVQTCTGTRLTRRALALRTRTPSARPLRTLPRVLVDCLGIMDSAFASCGKRAGGWTWVTACCAHLQGAWWLSSWKHNRPQQRCSSSCCCVCFCVCGFLTLCLFDTMPQTGWRKLVLRAPVSCDSLNSDYSFTSPQTFLHGVKVDLVDNFKAYGWTTVIDTSYGYGTLNNDVSFGHLGSRCLVVGAKTSSSATTLKVAAFIPASSMRTTSNNAPFYSGYGAYFYNTPETSFGFSPSYYITQNSADTAYSTDPRRLSWHIRSSSGTGGWRAGATTSLNGDPTWRKVVYAAPISCPSITSPEYHTISCSSGKYISNGACATCPAGYACPGGYAASSICPAGQRAQGTGQSSCSSCGVGVYCPIQGHGTAAYACGGPDVYVAARHARA